MATGATESFFSRRCKAFLSDDDAFAAWFTLHASVGGQRFKRSPCDKCSRSSEACVKSDGRPGCVACIDGKVRCSLQETYLFEKTRGEPECYPLRPDFDAARSVLKPRRRTRRAAAAPSAVPAPSNAVAVPHPLPFPPAHGFLVQPDSTMASNAPLMPPAAPSFPQHIDPSLLDDSADLYQTASSFGQGSPAPAFAFPVRTSQGVQTDDPSPPADRVAPAPIAFPSVPLESLDVVDLCRLVRSLTARVAYFEVSMDIESLARSSALASAVLRLPCEVVALIATHVCFFNDAWSRAFFDARRCVCLVCRSWFAGALAASSLWSTIVIHPAASTHYVRSIGTSSSLRPLSVYLSSVEVDRGVPRTTSILRFSDLWTTLSATAAQWQSLDLYSTDSRILFELFALVDSALAPMLKSLTVSCRSGNVDPRPSQFPSIPFDGWFPSLEMLHLDAVPFLLRALVPLPALVHLTVSGFQPSAWPSYHFLCDILSACPRLSVIHFLHVGCTDVPMTGVLPVFTGSSVSELRIQFGKDCFSIATLLRMLSCIRFPALRRLQLAFSSAESLRLYNSAGVLLSCPHLCVRAPATIDIAASQDITSFYASRASTTDLTIDTDGPAFYAGLAPGPTTDGLTVLPDLGTLRVVAVPWVPLRGILHRRRVRGSPDLLLLTRVLPLEVSLAESDPAAFAAYSFVHEVVNELQFTALPPPFNRPDCFAKIFSISAEVAKLSK
ncbi:hypothetical protein C8F04DRAFT_1259934 [Mycena alexandri]|uniref:Uncharacterized protein n=1 Tax=Mycena alexandri TaxID=1745969 RepID=A0AAD6SUQ5_9AGAR|nr:hypothetical protein C8F04DRAFT_1259934 [Mycena alexandri]